MSGLQTTAGEVCLPRGDFIIWTFVIKGTIVCAITSKVDIVHGDKV